MRTREQCRCRCHTDPNVKHVIDCCVPARRITNAMLCEIVEMSIGDAMAAKKLEDEADKERTRQASLAQKIDRTVGSGDAKDDSLEKELEKSAPDAGGAPKRGAAIAGADVPDAPPPQRAGTGEISPDSIIDKFNIIRSGHSMNDRDVRDRLSQYIGSLTQSQRDAVFAILKNVGGIVAPTAPLARTQAPQEEPTAAQNARLQMLKQKQTDMQPQEQPQEPAPEAAPPPPQQQAQPQGAPRRAEPAAPRRATRDREDTSPPIRVGKRTSESVQARMRLLLQD